MDTAAFRRTERNLVTDAGPAGPVSVAEMSAAGFRVARVAPRLGRFFVEDDERAGAPPVVVIGYNVWRSRFASDPRVIGRRVQLDGIFHTVTGVMPEDFAFPVNDNFWTPLQARDRERVTVFARLAPGATLERAHAELDALGLLPSDATGATPSRLKPRVVPCIRGISGERAPWFVRIVPLLFALLLVPPCTNIAVLIYARTVARQGEFAARTALGASRSRIAAQVFIEVFVLAAAAAGVALVLAPRVTQTLSYVVLFGNRGFWMDFSLSYGTILFATALALLAALIAGAIPALRATGRWQIAGGLYALNRGSAPRLGKTWTAIVVAQVALPVAVVPTSAEFAWDALRPAILGPGFEPGDPERSAILVNRSFVNRVLAGGNPLGRTVRVINRNGTATSYEIVGLVRDQFSQSDQAMMYRSLAPAAAVPDPGDQLSIRLAMHTASPNPPNLEKRLREIAASLNPTLRIDDLQSIDEIYWKLSLGEYIGGSGVAALALGIVLFSVAGIYTLMAFTVVQRRREIGIRSALGASPLRLVLGIFRRVLIPVSVGVALGGITALLLDFYWSPLLFVGEGGRPLPWILPAAEAFVFFVGVLAVFGPTRRVLRADPVEALRES